MRHGKRFNHLGRTAPHRKAMLSNMASSLILHKRISTTVAKAKALRQYVEPLLTKSKDDTTHSRRTVFSYLQNKDSVRVLFDEVAEKIATRPGGYTRIIKTGSRLGDNAEMCIIELVDYNELLLADSVGETAKKKTRRRGGKKSSSATGETDAVKQKATNQKKESDDVVVEEPKQEAKEEVAEKEATPKAEAKEVEIAEESVEAKVEQTTEDEKVEKVEAKKSETEEEASEEPKKEEKDDEDTEEKK